MNDIIERADRLARPRQIEHLAPGCWWRADLRRGDNIWVRIYIVRHLTSQKDGAKLVHIIGTDMENDFIEDCYEVGHSMPHTLKTAEARRIGLRHPGQED